MKNIFLISYLIGILQICNSQSVLDLYTNYNTIGVSIRLSDADIEKDAIGKLEYKEATGGNWKTGFPLSRVDNNLNVLTGSVFWCKPNTAYNIRVSINDLTTPLLDGQLLTGTIQTRQEFQAPIPLRTLFVSPKGTGNIFSQQQPGNLQDALNIAEAGTKIHLDSGNYYVGNLTIPNSGTATNPIQIVGSTEGQSTLNGSYETPLVWTPYGNKGVWQTSTSSINPNLVIADGVRLYPHQTYPDLKNNQITLEYIFCAPSHKESAGISGFYRNPTGKPYICKFGDPSNINKKKLYVKFLDGSNPNDKEIYVTKQGKSLQLKRNSHIYIKGINFKYYGLGSVASALIIDNSSDIVIDSCFFEANNTGIRLNHDSKNITIENTEFKDYFINWHAWKVKATQDNGVFLDRFPKLSRYIEKGGIMVGNDFYGRGIVIKNNRFNGYHQAGHIAPKMTSIPNIEDTLKRSFEIDFYNNELIGVTGDFELDGHSRNIRVFNNHFSHIHTFSVAPARDGPTYILRNVFDDIITDEFYYNSSVTQAKGQALKFQYGDKNTTSRNGDIFFFHNTINTGNIAFGMNFNQVTILNAFKRFVSKNNLIVNAQNINFKVRTRNQINLETDYNGYFSENNVIAHIDTNNTGGQDYTQIKDLFPAYGWEANSIQSNPLFADASNGDYRLTINSPVIDAGTIIPGINDTDYFGKNPDIGAFEWRGPTNALDEKEKNEITIVPNPVLADGKLMVKFNNYKGCKLIIRSLQGQLVYEQMLKHKETNIDMKGLQSGVYFIIINTGSKTFTDIIIKCQ